MRTNILLDGNDCVLWAAVNALDTRPSAPNTITTRQFLVYAERPRFQGKLCELVNGALVWLADLPGPKEGSAALLVGINTLTAIYSGRDEDDPTGPFRLKTVEIAVPGVQPLDWTAAARLRNVARIVEKYVPSTSPEIDPYTK